MIRGMEMVSNTAKYLAHNLRYLRSKKGFSQQQLAQLADIPRTTLTHMESGQGNPSLMNLVKVAGALSLGVEELLSRPRNDCVVIAADQVPVDHRSQGKVRVFSLLPDKLKGIAIERMEFEANASMGGHPHLSGTKEYMTVIQGEIVVYVAGEYFLVKQGDVFAFPGNQHHSYLNQIASVSIAISVVIPIPASA